MSRVWADGGSTPNLILYKLSKKLDRKVTREISEVKGVFINDLNIGSKTSKTSFFVAEADGSYNLLLGRDWIHGNRWTSILHEMLAFWNGEKVEYVETNRNAYVTREHALRVNWRANRTIIDNSCVIEPEGRPQTPSFLPIWQRKVDWIKIRWPGN